MTFDRLLDHFISFKANDREGWESYQRDKKLVLHSLFDYHPDQFPLVLVNSLEKYRQANGLDEEDSLYFLSFLKAVWEYIHGYTLQGLKTAVITQLSTRENRMPDLQQFLVEVELPVFLKASFIKKASDLTLEQKVGVVLWPFPWKTEDGGFGWSNNFYYYSTSSSTLVVNSLNILLINSTEYLLQLGAPAYGIKLFRSAQHRKEYTEAMALKVWDYLLSLSYGELYIWSYLTLAMLIQTVSDTTNVPGGAPSWELNAAISRQFEYPFFFAFARLKNEGLGAPGENVRDVYQSWIQQKPDFFRFYADDWSQFQDNKLIAMWNGVGIETDRSEDGRKITLWDQEAPYMRSTEYWQFFFCLVGNSRGVGNLTEFNPTEPFFSLIYKELETEIFRDKVFSNKVSFMISAKLSTHFLRSRKISDVSSSWYMKDYVSRF